MPMRSDEELPFFHHLGSHQAFANGTFAAQEMAHVYTTRRPKAALGYDTTGIAALFLTQSFDTEQAYSLYEGLLDRLASDLRPIAARTGEIVLPQLLSQQDSGLCDHLRKKGFNGK